MVGNGKEVAPTRCSFEALQHHGILGFPGNSECGFGGTQTVVFTGPNNAPQHHVAVWRLALSVAVSSFSYLSLPFPIW